jgi:hypothetical protein
MEKIAISSDNRVKLIGLTDDSGTIIGTATVTFSLTDSTGVAVVSGVAMPAVNADTGYYAGTLPHSLSLIELADYWLNVTATYGSVRRVWKEQCKAVYLS